MSERLSNEDVVLQLSRATDASPELPAKDVDLIRQFIQVGEFLLAFETLCTQLYEYEVVLSHTRASLLRQIGIALGADQHYLSLLDQENQ